MSTPLPPALTGLPPQQLIPPGQPPLVQLHPGQVVVHPSGAIIPPLPGAAGVVIPPPPPPPPPLPSNNNNNPAQKGNFHTVLITHIPPHLSNPRALREIAYPCGSTRGIFLVGHDHVLNSTHPATNPNIIGKAALLQKDDKHKGDGDKQEAVALIRMATTHGANTITRILPMAVKGVKVWNCSSGAILRNVVMANFQLKQEMKEEDDDNDNEHVNGNDNEKSEESTNNIPTEMKPETTTNTTTTEKVEQESSTVEKPPMTASTAAVSESVPSIMDSNPLTMILEQSYRKSSELPPMALKLAEISNFFYNEYKNLDTSNVPSTSTPTNTTNTDTNTTSSSEPIKESSEEQDPSMSDNNATLKLDVNKVAAAAGGGAYDEEADPLNAPQVLEAVAKFKKVLEERDTILKQKRMEIVSEKLKHAMTNARKNMEERKKLGDSQQPPLPPPLPPNPPPPPPPPGHEEDEGDIKESGKRMVSNLPAWMTKGSSTGLDNKRKLEITNLEQDPTMKRKQRIDVTSISKIRKANQDADKLQACKSFIQRNTSLAAILKKWITDKIVEYLGEEEETLIDFIMNQTLSEDTKKSNMMEEMQQVLDEDAEDFVKDLYSKVVELAENASS